VQDLIEGDYRPIEARRLNEETLRKFDYRRGEFKGQACHAATYHDLNGIAVAQKVRLPGKIFTWVGEPARAGLYGQHLWPSTGRKVVVTEGEIDALSMAQVQGLKWPVVSVPNGAKGAAKSIGKAVEWLEGYQEVVFMFDNDEPGKAAAVECAELLTPGKARIAVLPLKDANEMLVAGRVEELASAMWNARVYRPDGIVAGSDTWSLVLADDTHNSIPYPWLDLNEKTRGMRLGEIVTVCAGTGVGKSTAVREWAYHLVKTGELVGYVALEESVKRTAQGFMSIEMNRPLHLDRVGITEEQLKVAFDATLGLDRIFLYDHWGSIESEHLIRKIKQMVRGCGVQWIVLDHISIVVSGMESSNERKDLDIIMTKLRKLAEELNVGIFLVCHLRRKDGAKGHEQGAEVSLSDLRGTQGIAQLSDIVVALERDQQAEEDANKAKIRVLKNRFTGETGLAGAVQYNKETGRLTETDPFEVKPDAS
jgi:twinkle protein